MIYKKRKTPFCLVLLLLTLALPSGAGTNLPLINGKVLNAEIESSDEKGVTVRQAKGTIRIPWNQISPSFEQHPYHDRFLQREGHSGEYEQAKNDQSGETKQQDSQREDKLLGTEVLTSSFTKILLLAFVFFWIHIFCVWHISRVNKATGAAYQMWNLSALVLGVPVLLVFVLFNSNFGEWFSFRIFSGKKKEKVKGKAPAAVRFFAWDGTPIKSSLTKKSASGLETAETIVSRAIHKGASDIHFDTTGNGVKFAFRVDGVLREPDFLSELNGKQTMSALKMAAGIDVAKLHETQDGACHILAGDEHYDLRLARAYAVNGETLTVRLLRTSGLGSDLCELGMPPQIAKQLLDLTNDTAGITIISGPTGSGKTTTIYALLTKLVGTGRNILTIEDPVEYRLEGATQISLNPRINATFAGALKASMRHDPDIILVGEIRDAEALQVAFQAALTGHLVFAALHATSLLATLGRLQELGLSAYMINTGLKAIVCQRLVRMLCPSCRESYIPSPAELEFWGLSNDEPTQHCFYQPVGCHLCAETGYHGRQAVYRVLVMDNRVRKIMRPDMTVNELQPVIDDIALGKLSDYARQLLWSGETSPTELRKTLDMFDFDKSRDFSLSVSMDKNAPETEQKSGQE